MRGAGVNLHRFALRWRRPSQRLLVNAAHELALQCVNVIDRAFVGFSWWTSPHIGGSDDVQLMFEVIESEQAIVKGKDAIGEIHVELRRRRKSLELPHHVIGEVANATCGERRQSGKVGRKVLSEFLAQPFDDAAPHDWIVGTVANRDFVSPRGQHGAWPRPNESVATDSFSALHGFQQESILLAACDAQEGPDRRKQVSTQGLGHRYQGGVAAEAMESLVVGRDHEPYVVAEGITRIIPGDSERHRFLAPLPRAAYTRKVCLPDEQRSKASSGCGRLWWRSGNLRRFLWQPRSRTRKRRILGNNKRRGSTL